MLPITNKSYSVSIMKRGSRMIGLVLCCFWSSLSLMGGVHGSNVPIGLWGRQKGDPRNDWSFQLDPKDKLVKMTIDHYDVIYSLMFTTERNGVLYNSKKAGGWAGGDTVVEVPFYDDEKITAINGTVGSKNGWTVIKSLSFETDMRDGIIGPFGHPTDEAFSLLWDDAEFGGLYGLAGNYIEGIGVYLQPSRNRIELGRWGRRIHTFDDNYHGHNWWFHLEKNYHLETIMINHGKMIYSLMFTTQYQGSRKTSKMFGSNDGETNSEVIFASDEELIGISGTASDDGSFVISSLSLVTNKKTHGPFGLARGTSFSAPWAIGSFAGFYGLVSNSIDRIGVYVKA